MLSVIIPNYNKAQYLSKCIESVLEQTYKDLEIIIVDDCSSDNSAEIINEFVGIDSRITPILLKTNGGVSNARNIGIKSAQGKYITMLDSDDFYWNKNKLASEMKLIEKYGDNCIAYSYRLMVDEEGNPHSEVKNEKRYVSGKNMLYHFLTESNAHMYVQRDFVVKRKSIIEVGMYNTQESYYEDYDLLLRLLARCPIYYTGEFGTAYRIVFNGLSQKQKIDDARQFRIPMAIRKKYISLIDNPKKRMKTWLIWWVQSVGLELKIIRRKIYVRPNK